MTEPATPAAGRWRARLLDYLDGHATDLVADLAELVQVPSISGTAEENSIQDLLSARLAGDGLDVDAWPIPLAETLAAEDFPGVEVDRAEAWGTVGRLPGPAAAPRLCSTRTSMSSRPAIWSHGENRCRSPARSRPARCTDAAPAT